MFDSTGIPTSSQQPDPAATGDAPIADAGSVATAQTEQASPWFRRVVIAWCSALLASLLLTMFVEPRQTQAAQASIDSLAPTSTGAFASFVRLHSRVVEACSDLDAGNDAGFSAFAARLSESKQSLRELTTATVEDAWSREALSLLRKQLLGVYVDLQRGVERLLALPPGSSERAAVLDGLHETLRGARAAFASAAEALYVQAAELLPELGTDTTDRAIVERVFGLRLEAAPERR